MVSAAVSRSFLAPAMRPSGLASVSPGAFRIWGITATPVSKPDRPRANLGKTSRAMAIIIQGSECEAVRFSHQWSTGAGSRTSDATATAMTTRLSSR
ncbi:hypothetical protein D9M73_280540 [compost metagenome]